MPIIGIGASAGGIEAFRAFFETMPADSGFGLVVILHLPADRKSLLPEILSRWTSMRVVEAADGCTVEMNTVYLPPPGVAVNLRDGALHLVTPRAQEPRDATPIDMFFDSLALSLDEDAIGVVLSGTGSDGALGLKAIKACGGLTIAQGSHGGTDGTAPQHHGMPESAIATGAVDIVAPVEAIPAHIMQAQALRVRAVRLASLASQDTRPARLAVCAVLQRQLGHDFSGYKEKTFLRRVQRRMETLGITTLDVYVARLEADRDEVGTLFRDLLIGVTSFFRDADTFDELTRTVMPQLFRGKHADSSLRVWVPACSTGEEAYSLAMLLCEHADRVAGPRPRIQLFATDIDEMAINTARAGRYPSALLRGLAPERLARFFMKGNDGSYTVAKEVRGLCTFSTHSLIRDPPFSRIDLISCRNLLIYLDSEVQAAIFPVFHYSLAPGGILLLGSSETISRHEGLFAPIDRGHRIFLRRDTPSPPLQLVGRGMGRSPSNVRGDPPRGPTTREGVARMHSRTSARVLDRFGPAFVVANADGDIVQFSSRTGRYLESAAGMPTQNLFLMARPGLRLHLRAALKQAVQTGRPVEKPRVPLEMAGDENQRVTLVVEPLSEQGSSTVYLVVFLEAAADEPAAPADLAEGARSNSPSERELETELHDTREQLQAISEEHRTALEELRSANEELHSVNEELQSANEELETSKEEIQSINEELQTVNAQLAAKVDELDHKNSDLRNLFDSTQVATIFLDPYLVIRGFTPAVGSIYNLIPSDIGRPLTDIVSRVRHPDLRDDVAEVLRTLEPLERRVYSDDNAAHYLMRILPYRGPDSRVDGTLVTYVDVTSIVHAEQQQRLLVDELNHRVKNMLTVVIALATRTMRRSESLETFSASYMGRIHALNAAYSLLSAEAWQTVPLGDLLMQALKPFMTARTNIVMKGPRVLLEPKAALALGMAVHELTTNAVKYGALSAPEGVVNVTWRVEQQRDGHALVLDWSEKGGPQVVPPAHRGFGMTLIERGLKQDMAAEVAIEFAAQGLQVRLQAPLPSGAVRPRGEFGG